MQEDLKSVIDDIRRWQDLMHASERDVEFYAIEPLFPLLGWGRFEVSRQYSVGTEERGRVDYSLKIDDSNKVFLEAKAGSEDLQAHQEQLVVYTAKYGVPLGVLTNGHRWWFYLPLEEGPWERRRFRAIDLLAQEPSDIASELTAFLSRENVVTGIAVEEAKARLAKLKREREIAEYLPKAWDSLVTDTSGPLIDLLAETVEKGCGHRPGADRIQRFLKNMKRLEHQPPPELPSVQRRTRAKRPPFTFDMVGIEAREKLQFKDDPQIECEVIDNKNVRYKGVQYSLSDLAQRLKGSSRLAGPRHWTYKGEILADRRKRLET